MPGVRVREGDSIDKILRIFRRQCDKAGTKTELRKREAYEKPSVRRKKKSAQAQRRKIKQQRKQLEK